MQTKGRELPEDYYGTKVTGEREAAGADVVSTKSIIDAMYESLSGPAGVPRQWDRMRSLCVPEAYSIRVGRLPDGSMGCKIMRTEEYIRQMDAWLLANGFFEKEVHRLEERFGDIAHVFSTYESRKNADDPRPYMRGINSFQLMHDGRRWWVLNVMWEHESPEHPIPARYLK